jgi:hypothetical protein
MEIYETGNQDFPFAVADDSFVKLLELPGIVTDRKDPVVYNYNAFDA